MDLSVALAPRFTTLDGRRLAHDLFGLDGDISSLPSERDQNFLVRGPEGPLAVLKIANPSDPETVLDLQNRAIEHLARHAPTLTLPRIIPARSGAALTTTVGPDGRTYFVRALGYVPGKCLAEVAPHARELLRGLGARLGEMDRALATFTHPAMHRDLQWDLKHTGRLAEHLPLVEADRRRLIQDVIARFPVEIAPRFGRLRASVIHNDWNDHNILVATGPGADPRVVGAIDFGDLLYSHTVCDLAIALAYVLLDKPDPIAAATDVIRGYHETNPLEEPEIDLLPDLIRCRLATSVVMAARQQAAAPDNPYLGVSQTPVWRLLERLEGISDRWVRYSFRDACGLAPSPKSRAIVRWLEQRRTQIGPVVSPDAREVPTLVFDLSVGSVELTDLAQLGNAQVFTDLVFGRMRHAGAQVGIGRYDEARLAYRSELFQHAGADGPIWRTIHLGLDLFIEPGTPVLAPLDGVVHSFGNNARERSGAAGAPPFNNAYGPTIILEHRIDSGETFSTLYRHLSLESLDGLFKGKPVRRGDLIGTIGDSAVNGGWPPHLHLQIVTDLLDHEGDFPGVAPPDQRDLWLSLCPDPNLIAGLRHADLNTARIPPSALLASRHDLVGPSLSLAYRRPLIMLRGFRQYLYDHEGRAFLDAVNNVPHVGHCHPRVVQAGQIQMAVLNTNTRYLHPLLTQYAERLVATLPSPLRVCFFVNSGSEANELALRIARAHARGRDVIVVDGAYHGNTSTLVEISPYKFDGPGGGGRPDYVQAVCMPDPYRGPYRGTDPNMGLSYARHVGEAIDRIRAAGRSPCAFFCESLLSCGGQIVLPDGYLAEAYRLVRAAGGVCVADEVQVGLGRIGSDFWGFQTQHVVPDIVVLGKPMGNGHPLGAVVTTAELAASFANGMEFFSTFGGNPVSCAIGLAVLDVIRDEGLQEHAWQVGGRLLAELKRFTRDHPVVGDVRGRGLFIGVELVEDRETLTPAARQASYVINRMRDRGVLVSTDGPLHNVIKIKPPLVFSASDADRLVETLDVVLREDGAKPTESPAKAGPHH
ncbi:MAG: aminotransferase class III-fold pyridoxal phosphate-dependent enzyme [Acidobacteria bacterium]|nr:aminotransferase class III-fold pyridoxal phosphate-dependent enzyme [Acidobacteriota bacterium]